MRAGWGLTAMLQVEYIKELKQSLTSRDKMMADLSVRSFVDIFRVSTFGSKTDVSVLRLLVPDVQNTLLVCGQLQRDSLPSSHSLTTAGCRRKCSRRSHRSWTRPGRWTPA